MKLSGKSLRRNSFVKNSTKLVKIKLHNGSEDVVPLSSSSDHSVSSSEGSTVSVNNYYLNNSRKRRKTRAKLPRKEQVQNQQEDAREDIFSWSQGRRVDIDTARNEYYPSAASALHTRVERQRRLWYSEADVRAFRHETAALALTLQHREQVAAADGRYYYKSWGTALMRAHDGFCHAGAASYSVRTVMACSKTTMPATAVGLERRVLLPLVAARLERRQRQLQHIAALQAATHLDANLRAQKIAAISAYTSRPACLYARHLAQLAAHDEYHQQQQQHGCIEK